MGELAADEFDVVSSDRPDAILATRSVLTPKPDQPMPMSICCTCAQVTDTPGLLNRPDADRNVMENLTLACLEHLPCTMVFVTDLTAQCGTSVPDQLAIRRDLLQRFPGKAWLDVLSKADLLHGVVERLREDAAEMADDKAPLLAEGSASAQGAAAPGVSDGKAAQLPDEGTSPESGVLGGGAMGADKRTAGSTSALSGEPQTGGKGSSSGGLTDDGGSVQAELSSHTQSPAAASPEGSGPTSGLHRRQESPLSGLDGLLTSAHRISCTEGVGLEELKQGVLGMLQ